MTQPRRVIIDLWFKLIRVLEILFPLQHKCHITTLVVPRGAKKHDRIQHLISISCAVRVEISKRRRDELVELYYLAFGKDIKKKA
jgi:hypothetical protein